MNAGVQPFMIGEGWIEMRDGDESCRAIFDRHYSRRHYADGRKPKLIVGPGDKLLLLRADGAALFAWRRYKDDGGQIGVSCAIFRREGGGGRVVADPRGRGAGAGALARRAVLHLRQPSQGPPHDDQGAARPSLSGLRLLLLSSRLAFRRPDQEGRASHSCQREWRG